MQVYVVHRTLALPQICSLSIEPQQWKEPPPPNTKIFIFDRKCLHLIIKKKRHNEEETEYHTHTKLSTTFKFSQQLSFSKRQTMGSLIILWDSKGKGMSCS